MKTNNEDIIINEVKDDTSMETDYANDVKQFLKEHEEPEEQTDEDSIDSAYDPANAPADEDELTDANPDSGYTAYLETDSTFENDGLREMSPITINIRDNEVQITEDDKQEYLRAVLFDEPVELSTKMFGDKVKVTCRALTVYESALASAAVLKYAMDTPPSHAMFYDTQLQKYRCCMQVTAINEKKFDYATYKEVSADEKETQIKDLMVRAEKLASDTIAPRWGAMIHALNVFEHKLTRLNNAALNRDF